jgi:hypothetical protein
VAKDDDVSIHAQSAGQRTCDLFILLGADSQEYFAALRVLIDVSAAAASAPEIRSSARRVAM